MVSAGVASVVPLSDKDGCCELTGKCAVVVLIVTEAWEGGSTLQVIFEESDKIKL